MKEYEAASGGGKSTSTIYGKPSWQVSPGVPDDGARDVPDVSLNADDINVPYLVATCSNSSGSCKALGSNDPVSNWPMYGGTSAATPSLAGIMALLVQRAGGVGQGNFNSVLYQLGQAQYGDSSGALAVFNDVTDGTNGFVDTEYGADLPGYSCGSGYDQVTGLGSVNALNLLLAFEDGLTTPYFTVSAPSSVIAGTKFNFTVTAVRSGSNAVSDDFGALNFTSTDSSATFPSSTALSSGTGTFSAVLNETGSQTITATSAWNTSITGISNTISVTPQVNGACGSANGQGFSTIPTTGLCSAGHASAVNGTGPWTWTCVGNDGTNTGCSANLDGACGSANGGNFLRAPASNLCSAGKASAVTGKGQWKWSCAGSKNGSPANCSANIEINGACGSANGKSLLTAPATNLCKSGASSTVAEDTDNRLWDWACEGSNGGTDAPCSAKLKVNGACGSANKGDFLAEPVSGFCSAGNASVVNGQGPWRWTCAGLNGGAKANCSANLEANGACGSADGENLLKAPTANLCSAGKASKVTGKGPWTWTCAGSNGGATPSCSADPE